MALPLLIDKFELTLSAAGLLLFANSLGYLLAAIAFPFVQRRHPAAAVLSVSFLIAGSAYLLLPLSPIWSLIVAFGFISSLGTGAIDVGFNTLISGLEPTRAKTALNWLHFSFGLGALVAPAMLSRLLGLGFSWSSFYITAGSFSLLLLLFWQHHSRQAANRPGEEQENRNDNALGLYKETHFLLLLTAIFIYVAAEVALAGWIPTLLTQRGVSVINASLGISVLWGGITLGRALTAKVINRFSARNLLLVLIVGASLAMFALIFVEPLWLTYAVLFFTGFFFSAIFPLILLHSAFLFPQFVAASASALVVAGSFGALVGPTLLGLVGQYYSLQAGIGLLSALMLFSGGIVLAVPTVNTSQGK